jgi:acetyl-CoA carboxylase biotin carboxyl carrier protein
MNDPTDTDESLPDLRYVRELARVFKQYGLDEIEIETGDRRILMRRGAEPGTSPQVFTVPASAQVLAPSPIVAGPSANVAPVREALDTDFILSPFVGTFYAAPRPDTPLFVQPGEKVQPGKTVCIVEAMKLFNEIEAEFACVIEEPLVETGAPVEYGTKLFRVRRL